MFSSIKKFFMTLIGKGEAFAYSEAAKGSALAKQGALVIARDEAKLKIVALDDANKGLTAVANFLETEATRIHTETDALKARIEAIHASLS